MSQVVIVVKKPHAVHAHLVKLKLMLSCIRAQLSAHEIVIVGEARVQTQSKEPKVSS